MTVEQIIGECLLRIGGGVVTPELTTRWPEAKYYLAISANYVMTGNYWLESKAEGERIANPLLFTSFDDIPIQYSATHRRYYSDLPVRALTLSKGRAVHISTMCGKKCYPLNTGDAELEEFYGGYKDWISYELEGKNRAWIWNKPKLVNSLRAKIMVHIDDMEDTDYVLLPSDGDAKVIDMMVSFLTGERKEEKDYIEDAKAN